jgi:hypothetical protein
VPWTIDWSESTITAERSDCFSSADALGQTAHDRRITEDASIGATLCALADLGPGNQISYIAQIGTQADYYLNGSNNEVIEISGTNDPNTSLSTVRASKTSQVLKSSATAAWICVVHFDQRQLILEMVR